MSLTITSVRGAPENDNFGNLSYWVNIEGVDGNVLVKHKPEKPLLKIGDDAIAAGFERVDDVQKKDGSGSYKKLMRPAFQGPGEGGGGPRGRDPKESAQIVRQHSQEMALRYAALRVEKELLPSPFKLTDLTKVIDWFEADAKAATP